jgi:hypothetical protein
MIGLNWVQNIWKPLSKAGEFCTEGILSCENRAVWINRVCVEWFSLENGTVVSNIDRPLVCKSGYVNIASRQCEDVEEIDDILVPCETDADWGVYWGAKWICSGKVDRQKYCSARPGGKAHKQFLESVELVVESSHFCHSLLAFSPRWNYLAETGILRSYHEAKALYEHYPIFADPDAECVKTVFLP